MTIGFQMFLLAAQEMSFPVRQRKPLSPLSVSATTSGGWKNNTMSLCSSAGPGCS